MTVAVVPTLCAGCAGRIRAGELIATIRHAPGVADTYHVDCYPRG